MQPPEPHFRLLDRYLALCEHAGVTAAICFNKLDLGIPAEVQEAILLYILSLGYPVLQTGATAGSAWNGYVTARRAYLAADGTFGRRQIVYDERAVAGYAAANGRDQQRNRQRPPAPTTGWPPPLAKAAGSPIPPVSASWRCGTSRQTSCRCASSNCAIRGRVPLEDCRHTADEEGCALRAALARAHRPTPLDKLRASTGRRARRGETHLGTRHLKEAFEDRQYGAVMGDAAACETADLETATRQGTPGGIRVDSCSKAYTSRSLVFQFGLIVVRGVVLSFGLRCSFRGGESDVPGDSHETRCR